MRIILAVSYSYQSKALEMWGIISSIVSMIKGLNPLVLLSMDSTRDLRDNSSIPIFPSSPLVPGRDPAWVWYIRGSFWEPGMASWVLLSCFWAEVRMGGWWSLKKYSWMGNEELANLGVLLKWRFWGELSTPLSSGLHQKQETRSASSDKM